METSYHERPWLDALKRLQRTAALLTRSEAQTGAQPDARDIQTAKLEDDPEVDWRVAVLRPQVPARGPIRHLAARPDSSATRRPGHCSSCGDPLPAGRHIRCGACVRAIEIAINSIREGVK